MALPSLPRAAALGAAVALTLAACGSADREVAAPVTPAPTTPAPAGVELPDPLAERVGTLEVTAPGIDAAELAATLDTQADAADGTTRFAEAEQVLRVATRDEAPAEDPAATEDATAATTVAMDLRCDATMLTVRTPDPADPDDPLSVLPYEMGLTGPDGFTPFAPAPQDGATTFQVDRAWADDAHAVWTHGPELDLFAFTWQLLHADVATGEVTRLTTATESLGVPQVPSFGMWYAPVVAGDTVYHSSVLPSPDGALRWDDGSRWTSGLLAVPIEGGRARVLADNARMVATDGSDVVHVHDGNLDAGGVRLEAGEYEIVEQRADSEAQVWVTGTLPERSSVTALALSEDLLVWVVSRDEQQDATLLALERASGALHAVTLHDLLAHPDVDGLRVGWGNWSGNGDPGEYLWDLGGAGTSGTEAGQGSALQRIGLTQGASRVRVCGDLVAATGTTPAGTLVDTVVRLPR